jgi:hypothetical protein
VTIKPRIQSRLKRQDFIFIRDDFKDSVGCGQVDRTLKELAKEGQFLKVGCGVSATLGFSQICQPV